MDKISRRSLIAGASALAALATQGALALPLRPTGSTSSPPTPVATITLYNGGSTYGGGSLGGSTQLIGCPFPKGMITSGTWPQFRYQDGSTVKTTILNGMATFWSDNSLKFVPVMFTGTPSIAGSGGTNTVQILTGGTLPSSSGLTLAQLYNGIQPQVQGDVLDNGLNTPATFICDLKAAIIANATGTITKYGDGQAGIVAKVRALATVGGTVDGQLVTDFYVFVLANPDGTLRGLRILPKLKLPYYDQPSGVINGTNSQNWMTFTRLQMVDAVSSTVLFDLSGTTNGTPNNAGICGKFGSGGAFNCTYDGNANNQLQFVSGNGFTQLPYTYIRAGDKGYACRASNIVGTGLNTNTTYFIAAPSSTGTFGLELSASAAMTVAKGMSVTGLTSCTLTPMPILPYFGSLFFAQSTGDPIYVQGAGSDSGDTPLIHQIAQQFWLSTLLIPPYNYSLYNGSIDTNAKAVGDDGTTGVLQNAPAQFPGGVPFYWPNASCPIVRYLEAVGERDDLGINPSWYARWFYTQDPGDRQYLRVLSLCGAQIVIGLENSTTQSYPCVNNGHNGAGSTYPGMPAPVPAFRWDVHAATSNFGSGVHDWTDPSNPMATFVGIDMSHMCNFHYLPYLGTGEPWHLDSLLEFGNAAIFYTDGTQVTASVTTNGGVGGVDTYVTDATGLHLNARNVTVGTNPARWGTATFNLSNGERSAAWSYRQLVQALAMCPASHYAKPYFTDMHSDSVSLANDMITSRNALGTPYNFLMTVGLWCIEPGKEYYNINPHSTGYYCSVLYLSSMINESEGDANLALLLTNYLCEIYTNIGNVWHAGGEHVITRLSQNAGDALVNDWTHIHFGTGSPLMTMTNASPAFHLQSVPNNYVMQNGDKIIWSPNEGNNTPINTPPGFEIYKPMYVLNLNGSKDFDLATSPTGTPVTPSCSPTCPTTVSGPFFVSQSPPATESQDAWANPQAFNTIENHGAMFTAAAVVAAAAILYPSWGLTLPTNFGTWSSSTNTGSGAFGDFNSREIDAVDFSGDPKWTQGQSFYH